MSRIKTTKDLFVSAGSRIHKMIVNEGANRQEAINSAVAILEETGLDGGMALYVPRISLDWAECGFPILEPSHRLAASLMATSMPDECIDEFVRMPWRCFAVLCPSGLIANDQALLFANRLPNGRIEAVWFFDEFMGFGEYASLADWNKQHGLDFFDENYKETTAREVDARRSDLMARLFVSVCAEVNQFAPSAVSSNGDGGAKRKSKEPTAVSHKLTRAVSVDVRDAVRSYATGLRRSSPKTQTMVRGHWKLQAHGEQQQLRKLIHIEPYWRGADDAPIAIRSHKVD